MTVLKLLNTTSATVKIKSPTTVSMKISEINDSKLRLSFSGFNFLSVSVEPDVRTIHVKELTVNA